MEPGVAFARARRARAPATCAPATCAPPRTLSSRPLSHATEAVGDCRALIRGDVGRHSDERLEVRRGLLGRAAARRRAARPCGACAREGGARACAQAEALSEHHGCRGRAAARARFALRSASRLVGFGTGNQIQIHSPCWHDRRQTDRQLARAVTSGVARALQQCNTARADAGARHARRAPFLGCA